MTQCRNSPLVVREKTFIICKQFLFVMSSLTETADKICLINVSHILTWSDFFSKIFKQTHKFLLEDMRPQEHNGV